MIARGFSDLNCSLFCLSFDRGVYVDKNTFRSANVRGVSCKLRALRSAAAFSIKWP